MILISISFLDYCLVIKDPDVLRPIYGAIQKNPLVRMGFRFCHPFRVFFVDETGGRIG